MPPFASPVRLPRGSPRHRSPGHLIDSVHLQTSSHLLLPRGGQRHSSKPQIRSRSFLAQNPLSPWDKVKLLPRLPRTAVTLLNLAPCRPLPHIQLHQRSWCVCLCALPFLPLSPGQIPPHSRIQLMSPSPGQSFLNSLSEPLWCPRRTSNPPCTGVSVGWCFSAGPTQQSRLCNF